MPVGLAGPVILYAKFCIYASALLNEINNKIINNLAYLITIDLVSFCYYTVVDKNTHAINCLYMHKHLPKWGRNDAHIQVVILVRLSVRSPELVYLQTACINRIVYTFGEIFVTFYTAMLTPSMTTRWGLTATLQ